MRNSSTGFVGLLLLSSITGIARAQSGVLPLEPGMIVATCYGTTDARSTTSSPFVIGAMDTRYPPNALRGVNWIPPMYHGPGDSWTVTNLGQVFGVTLDDEGNIYATATVVYPLTASDAVNRFGPGGSGGVYRLDGRTGAIKVLARLPASAQPAGLGNICYDPIHHQLFVSNFEDGRIYRLAMDGTVNEAYDPLGPDDGRPGFAPRGERIWAVAVHAGRLYYSTWATDYGVPTSTDLNTIRSAAIAPDGSIDGTTDALELQTPIRPGGKPGVKLPSQPVASIAFSEGGRMLLAERTMVDIVTSAHASRVLEYLGGRGSWGTPRIYSIGFYNRGEPPYANAAGGADYGPTRVQRAGDAADCDSTVWATGDALRFRGSNPSGNDYVYGMIGMPASGNTPATLAATSTFVDFDANTTGVAKTYIGALKVMRACGALAGTTTDTVTICIGDSIALQASDGVAYTWSGGPGLSCYNCRITNAAPSVTTTYVALVRRADTRVEIDSFTVVIDVDRTIRFHAGPASTTAALTLVPIEASTPLDAEALSRFTVTLAYNPTLMYRIQSTPPVPVGPVAGWTLRIASERRGSITLEFTAPGPGIIARGSGVLTLLQFEMMLARQDHAPLALSASLPPVACRALITTADTVAYSVCGQNLRLIEAIPQSATIDDCRPNPFNPSADITFTLPAAGHAMLAVFDAAGKQMAVLVDEELPGGKHTVRLDATAWPSGTYFSRLRFGPPGAGWSAMRALVLMR